MKNIHIEHLEDGIFEPGGIKNVLSVLRNFKKCNVTRKYDGETSIVCGRDPENKNFFLGTKSVFNTRTPIRCYSTKDINKYYSDNRKLRDDLKVLFDLLRTLNLKTVLQGDLLCCPNTIKTSLVDINEYICLQPNTIVYLLDKNSLAYQYIVAGACCIAFHTEYKGNSWNNLKCQFLSKKSIRSNNSVYIPEIAIVNKIEKNISPDKTILELVNTRVIDNLFSDKYRLREYVKRYINTGIRRNNLNYSIPLLTEYISTDYANQIRELKTDKGKLRKSGECEKLIELIRYNAERLFNLFSLHNNIVKCKTEIMKSLDETNSSEMQTYFLTEGKLESTSHEGYVASYKDSVYKLVDRCEFSRRNFQQDK